jgi:glycosyltransferase involved in cell wall biosynthesis
MFSIIMPVYNHADYVAEAVESVRKQSFQDWELIIVDDGSTDGSAGLVDELARQDARIVALHQANAGPAAARNAGLDRATGQWLTYLDSDDVWYGNALENFARFAKAHGDAKFIYGYRHRLEENGRITKLPGEFQDRPTGTKELFGRMYLSHLCVCYRRKLLDLAGRYDPSLRTCEDYELYLRISLHCRFEPLGLPTGLRRRHGTNISRQSGRSRMLEAEVLRRFVERQGGSGVLDERTVARRLGQVYYSAARQYFKARCYRQAIDASRLAHRHRRTIRSAGISLFSRCLLPFGRTDGECLPTLG